MHKCVEYVTCTLLSSPTVTPLPRSPSPTPLFVHASGVKGMPLVPYASPKLSKISQGCAKPVQ
jgi:hypothetical protein